MGKIIFRALFLLLFSMPNLTAALPDWVKDVISKNKNIQYHPDASALILLNECMMTIDDNASAEFTFRKVIRILKKEAVFDYGIVGLPKSEFIEISNFKGWILRTDNSEAEIDEDALIGISSQLTSAYFDNSQVALGMLPRIGVGSIAAFEYTIEEEGENCYFQQFVFQNKQPVVFSKLSLEIPDDWNIYYTGLRTKEIEFTKTREKITWQCKNLEYEPEEILTLPDEFLQKKILFTCYNQEKVENQDFSSWKNVSGWCYRVFQESAGKNENLISAANDLIKNCRNNEEKINTIARFVQNEIRYVAIEIGKNRWIPRPAITTFENRYGDCKDKTMLMIEMLSSTGIESYPVFVGSAKPVFDELPSPYQFNHCVVGIPVNQMNNISYLENSVYNGYLIFDPTDYRVKLGELPLALHNSGALIATPDNPGLFYLEKTSPEEYLEVIEADASIDAVGTLAVKIKIQFFKAIAYSMLYELKQLSFEEQREFFYAMLKDEIPNPQIDYIDLQNNKDTLTAYLNISAHNYAQVDSIFYLKAQLIDLETFPELKPKERHFPIWLGAPRKTRITTKWKFPEGYKPVSASDSLTANIECASAFYYSTIYKNGANTVVEVQYTGMPMPPERYSDAILFNQRLNKFNSQVIVLNRGVK